MNLAEQNLQTIRNRISTNMGQLKQHQESQGASGLIKDFGISKSAKIESLPSAFILLGGTAPSQAGCDENFVFFSANLLLYAFTAR